MLLLVNRNLAKAESCFREVQEKLNDEAYSGWFLRFKNGSKYYYPRCYRERTQLDPSDAPCDCGGSTCGTYLWDHRNASLREWLGTVHVAGPTGVASPYISGLYLDDGWTANNSAPPPHGTISPPFPQNGYWTGHGPFGVSEVPSDWINHTSYTAVRCLCALVFAPSEDALLRACRRMLRP